MMDENPNIHKDRVIGYVVTKYESTIRWNSIPGWWESFEDYTYNLDLNEDVMYVVPAQPNTFKISVVCPDCGESEVLGYEFEGAYRPDWASKAKETLEMSHKCSKKK